MHRMRARNLWALPASTSVWQRRRLSVPSDSQLRMTADDTGYWQQLWRSGGDSFTLEEPNANLITHLDDLLPGRSNAPIDPRSVLVPLCGRSVDLVFLESRQRAVWGVDIAGAALQRFAKDQGGGVASSRTLQGHTGFRAYRLKTLPRLTLVHADFLALHPRDYRDPQGAPLAGGPLAADDDTPPFDAVWDRGGLTSMPPALRVSYASLLHSLLRPGARALVEFLSPSTDPALGEDAVTGLLAGRRVQRWSSLATAARGRPSGVSGLCPARPQLPRRSRAARREAGGRIPGRRRRRHCVRACRPRAVFPAMRSPCRSLPRNEESVPLARGRAAVGASAERREQVPSVAHQLCCLASPSSSSLCTPPPSLCAPKLCRACAWMRSSAACM